MQKIKICDKEYSIDCNAYTYVQYKKIFGKGLFSDLQIIKGFLTKQSRTILEFTQNKNSQKSENEVEKELNIKLLDYVDDYIEAITRLAYIFIYEANSNFKSYEEFMKDIPKLSIDDDWVFEVTEFAVEKFC